MESATIRERLHEYIRFADDKKVQAIYTMVETEIEEELDLWEDEGFLDEMKSRIDEYENADVKTLSLDEFKQNVLNR